MQNQKTPVTSQIAADAPYPDRMLIGGNWVASATGSTIDVENPATRQIIGQVPCGANEDVNRAVAAAKTAFPSFSRVVPRDRGKLLLDIAYSIESEIENIARTIATETGNALATQARPEATVTADIFRYFGGLAGELKGETIPLGEHQLSYSRREPVGVVGAIIPWNAPVLLAALKIAPALCAGNTIVVKAAEDAPLGVLMLAEICQRHLPESVLNVLTGFGEDCGTALAAHPDVHKLSFTGSTEVGKLIMKSASDRLAPVSLELGGKSPSIVCPDANEDWIADGVMAAMRFTRQSQSCTAGSRLFLHDSIYDAFLEKLSSRAASLKIGNPLDEDTEMGAIISKKQFSRVCQYVEEGLSLKSAELVTGGMPPTSGPLSEGYFAVPTIFSDASNDWRLAREEIFGPVLVAIRWKDEEDVIRMANESHYGLAAFVWSQNISRALRLAHAVEAGWVQVNQGSGQQLGQSYGGTKQSGIGREFSLEGMLNSYTQTKSVTVNLNTPT